MICCLVFVVIMCIPTIAVKAASLGLSGVPSEVKIGESFTISTVCPNNTSAKITLSYNPQVITFVSGDNASGGNGAVIITGGSWGDPNGSSSNKLTFKAVSAGKSQISISTDDAVDIDLNSISLGGASATVTVVNEASAGNSGSGNGNSNSNSGGGNQTGDNNGEEAEKSGNNSLASLKLSTGKLSPNFKYNVVSYTATVPYEVTDIAITATPSHKAAKVESVTGNENLKVGENVIKIVVKAENGVAATYTIKVTREAEGQSSSESETTSESESQTEEVPGSTFFTVDGAKWFPVEEISQEEAISDFLLDKISIEGKEYPCLKYNNGDISLLYLTDEERSQKVLYVYESENKQVYQFIRLNSEKGFVIFLRPETNQISENYSEESLTIEGKGKAVVYQNSSSGNVSEEFYLFYGVNQAGEKNWYQYDASEGTYQRFTNANQSSEKETLEDVPASVTEDTEMQQEYEKMQQRIKIVLIVCGVILLLLLGIIIFLLATRRKNKEESANWDIDDEFADLSKENNFEMLQEKVGLSEEDRFDQPQEEKVILPEENGFDQPQEEKVILPEEDGCNQPQEEEVSLQEEDGFGQSQEEEPEKMVEDTKQGGKKEKFAEEADEFLSRLEQELRGEITRISLDEPEESGQSEPMMELEKTEEIRQPKPTDQPEEFQVRKRVRTNPVEDLEIIDLDDM